MIEPVFNHEGDHVADHECGKPAVATTEDGAYVCQDCADGMTLEGFGTSFFGPDTSQIYKGSGYILIVRSDGTSTSHFVGTPSVAQQT